MSESEQFLKGTSQIKTLSAADIEGMRVVCRVRATSPKLSQSLSRRADSVLWSAAGAGGPGHRRHDGEAGDNDGGDRPRRSSGISPFSLPPSVI